MATMSREDSRIRDGVRDLKIRLDIPRKFNQKVGPFTSKLNRSKDEYGCHEEKRYLSDYITSRVRMKIHFFNGTPDQLVDWADTVEEFFVQMDIPEQLRCKIASYAMEEEVEHWWQQLQLNRLEVGKSKIYSWEKMKHILFKNFSFTTCSTKCPSEIYRCQQIEEDVCDYPYEPYHTKANTTTQATIAAEVGMKQIGKLAEDVKDNNQNSGDSECFADEQSKEEITVTPVKFSTICFFPIQKCEQCEKSDCNCPNHCYSITPDTSINATTETESRVKQIEVTMDYNSKGTRDFRHKNDVTFENNYTLAFAQLDVANKGMPRVHQHYSAYDDAEATTIKRVLQAKTATKGCLEEASDLTNENATKGKSMEHIKLASLHTRKEVMKLHAIKDPLDMLVHELVVAVTMSCIHLEEKLRIKYVREAGLCHLEGNLVALASEVRVRVAGLDETALLNGNIQPLDFLIGEVSMFTFDPGGCGSINQLTDQLSFGCNLRLDIMNESFYEEIKVIVPRSLLHRAEKHAAKKMLTKTITLDSQAVRRHTTTILDSAKESDATFRKRALELLYVRMNDRNAKPATNVLIHYLEEGDLDCRGYLTAKIHPIVERFSPEKMCHTDRMLGVENPLTESNVVGAVKISIQHHSLGLGTHALHFVALFKLSSHSTYFSKKATRIISQYKVSLIVERVHRAIEFSSIVGTYKSIMSAWVEGMLDLNGATYIRWRASSVPSVDLTSKEWVDIPYSKETDGLAIMELFIRNYVYLTRGRVILWEGWNDENNSTMERKFVIVKTSVVTFFSCLSILRENSKFNKALKLFYKVVNGLDPPMDVDVDGKLMRPQCGFLRVCSWTSSPSRGMEMM